MKLQKTVQRELVERITRVRFRNPSERMRCGSGFGIDLHRHFLVVEADLLHLAMI